MTANILWENLPASLAVDNAEILVIGVDPVLAPADEQRLVEQLPAGERARAEKLLNAEARRQFVACRRALRDVLARLTGLPANELEFDTSPFGKPFLAAPAGCPDWQFNVAHTQGLGLIAVSRSLPVGIDVERVSPIDIHGIQATAFTRREQQRLSECPADQRLAWFYQLWTRKEALLKGAGVGFSVEPAAIDVAGNDPPTQISIALPGATQSWRVIDLVPTPQHLGAIAHPESRVVTLRFYRFPCGW
jgi:4'-phosphopantetheinyl transferase